ncbi:MAG: hypothetical protein L3J34_11650 [Flavobacteriaceae bacterium]|nr:hypothetical protein [Flavobacteriaceae bacterium]
MITFFLIALIQIIKNLELEKMEKMIGGSCKLEMGLSAVVGGMIGRPLVFIAFGAWAYYMSPYC